MKYIRKTVDEYHIQGFYFGQWETVTIDETLKDARQMLKDYRDNERNTCFRIIKKRERII